MDRELNDELRFHLEHQIEKYVRAGLPRAEGKRRAHIDFGGVEQIAEDTRSVRGIARLDALLQDVRYVWRGVKARPGFAAAISPHAPPPSDHRETPWPVLATRRQ